MLLLKDDVPPMHFGTINSIVDSFENAAKIGGAKQKQLLGKLLAAYPTKNYTMAPQLMGEQPPHQRWLTINTMMVFFYLLRSCFLCRYVVYY